METETSSCVESTRFTIPEKTHLQIIFITVQWLPVQMKSEKELRVVMDAFPIVFGIQIVWEQWHFQLPCIENLTYLNFEMFLLTCEHSELSAACAQAHQQAQVFQSKRFYFIAEAHFKPVLHSASWRLRSARAGLDVPKGTSFYTHICNTQRKPFAAVNACHLLTPILLLSSTDPADRSALSRARHGACPCLMLHSWQPLPFRSVPFRSVPLRPSRHSGSWRGPQGSRPATVQPQSGLRAARSPACGGALRKCSLT